MWKSTTVGLVVRAKTVEAIEVIHGVKTARLSKVITVPLQGSGASNSCPSDTKTAANTACADEGDPCTGGDYCWGTCHSGSTNLCPEPAPSPSPS